MTLKWDIFLDVIFNKAKVGQLLFSFFMQSGQLLKFSFHHC